MKRPWTRLLAAVTLALCLAGCASPRGGWPGASRADTSWMRTELFFGMSRPGGVVTEKEWFQFLDDYVTPRFEEGLTAIDAYGQCMTLEGFAREDAKVLILLHEDTPAADSSIEHIRASYRSLFDQESVLRVSMPVHVSFKETAAALRARKLGELANEEIDESSGVAFATTGERVLWTHNDSGDEPRVFAVDLEGGEVGVFKVKGADARDWEDMCSVRMGGKGYLLFADTGDNYHKRGSYALYLVEEPVVRPGEGRTKGKTTVARTIRFRYEDGAHDCEAVAMDPDTQRIYLVTKSWGWRCRVYVLDGATETGEGDLAEAKAVATLRLPRAVAMDFSPDGERAVILTYGDAYEFIRKPGESWEDVFKHRPRAVRMPRRRKGEAICYGPESRTLYLTSEKLPAPLWEVTLAGD